MKIEKTLKDFNEIYKNRETASLSEIAEASAYFASIGGQFTDRSKELKKRLDSATSEDLKRECSYEQLELDFGDTVFTLKDSTIVKVEIDEKELVKISSLLDPSFFEQKTVVIKDNVVKAYQEDKLPLVAKPFVSVYTQTSLALKKKPRKRGK